MNQQHNHHYLIWGEVLLLLILVISAIGPGGLLRLSHVFPFVLCVAALSLTLKLCAVILQIADPKLGLRRGEHMHGSALPVTIFAPKI